MTVLASAWTDAHLALFNAAPFHALNLEADERYVRADHTDDRGRLVGSLCGRLRDDGTFVGGASAPFGGVDLVDPDAATTEAVAALLDDTLAQLRELGAARAQLRARPPAHGPGAAAVEAALHAEGFVVTATAVNQHLDLSAWTDAEAYLAALPKKRRWALRQDFAAGGVLLGPDEHDGWAQVHEIIDEARIVKGRPRWLPADYLRRLRDAFPGRIAGHLLTVEDVPVAAAVVFGVSDGIDLLAAWGDTGQLRRSPMNLLAFRLVEQALAGGARVLDMGISSEPDGTPNDGLIHFKRSVGALDGARLTFAKELA